MYLNNDNLPNKEIINQVDTEAKKKKLRARRKVVSVGCPHHHLQIADFEVGNLTFFTTYATYTNCEQAVREVSLMRRRLKCQSSKK